MSVLKIERRFREVINTINPQANSLMFQDMPPAVKILADWGRAACKKIDELQAELEGRDQMIKALAGDIVLLQAKLEDKETEK